MLFTYIHVSVCLYSYITMIHVKNPIQFLTCKFKIFYEVASNTNVHFIHKDLKQWRCNVTYVAERGWGSFTGTRRVLTAQYYCINSQSNIRSTVRFNISIQQCVGGENISVISKPCVINTAEHVCRRTCFANRVMRIKHRRDITC
jgi:hypothetical protein